MMEKKQQHTELSNTPPPSQVENIHKTSKSKVKMPLFSGTQIIPLEAKSFIGNRIHYSMAKGNVIENINIECSTSVSQYSFSK